MSVILYYCFIKFPVKAKQQSAVHLVASRQTGTATSILRLLLNSTGKEIRLKPDGVRNNFYYLDKI